MIDNHDKLTRGLISLPKTHKSDEKGLLAVGKGGGTRGKERADTQLLAERLDGDTSARQRAEVVWRGEESRRRRRAVVRGRRKEKL